MNKLNDFSGIAHWLPRLALAAIFIYHGYPKLAMAGDTASMMGMSVFMVVLIGLMEIGGSLLMLWGGFGPDWATRVAGILFAIVMIGAISMVHFQHGWNSINMGNNGGRGMEFQVLILATSLLYLLRGNALNAKVETTVEAP